MAEKNKCSPGGSKVKQRKLKDGDVTQQHTKPITAFFNVTARLSNVSLESSISSNDTARDAPVLETSETSDTRSLNSALKETIHHESKDTCTEIPTNEQDSDKCEYRSTPIQPRNIVYPRDIYNRRFLVAWYDQFPWLEWDTDLEASFCHVCRQSTVRQLTTTSKSRDEFTKVGYTNWKNGPQNFIKHEKSESHRLLSYKLTKLLEGENVAARLQCQIVNNKH